MSGAGRGGSAKGRRRGTVVLAVGAVIFGIAGWQQVAQAAPDPAARPSVSQPDVSVSFASPVAASTTVSSPTTTSPTTTSPTTTSPTTTSPTTTGNASAPNGVEVPTGGPGPTGTGVPSDAQSNRASGTRPDSAAAAQPDSAPGTQPDLPLGAPSDLAPATLPEVIPGADTVTPGGSLPVHGAGLAPASRIRILLDDTVELAVVDVDEAGDFSVEIPIPADTDAGEHVISAVPAVSGSGLRAAGAALRSAAPAALASFPIRVMPALIPPGGAGANTDGTTSTVSPSTVAIGGTLSFTVGGNPAGETVYVKIDDGQYQGVGKISGADIVATAAIGSDGTASGSITIPSDLAAGEHTLRFLASAKPASGSGNLGYTHRSDVFTVTAGSSPDPAGSNDQDNNSNANNGNTGATTSGGSTTSTTTSTATSAAGGSGTTNPGTGTGGGTGSGSTTDGSLASTGVDPVVGMAIGLGFMLAGAGMIIGLRRESDGGHA